MHCLAFFTANPVPKTLQHATPNAQKNKNKPSFLPVQLSPKPDTQKNRKKYSSLKIQPNWETSKQSKEQSLLRYFITSAQSEKREMKENVKRMEKEKKVSGEVKISNTTRLPNYQTWE